MQFPIACTLTTEELRDRRRTILDAIRQMQISAAVLPDGYSYAFEPTAETLQQLAHLVELERQCCPFLTFKIIVEAQGLPIRLEVTGPPEANAVIAEFFGDAE